jgi:NADH-quinone oxidoreductase subunit J
MTSRNRMVTRLAPLWLLALALLAPASTAQAQPDPDDPAASAANPPHGAPGHVHGTENPPHGAPGHVHGTENAPHGAPGHVHGTEAAPGAGAIAPAVGEAAGAGHGTAGHATPGAASGDAALNDDSVMAAAFFWLFALMMVGGSVFVITRRNLISAVMGMVGTFFAIAATFTMLYAHFLAAIQVLVYAGAIMVLFVFVIMIMNKPEDDPWGRVGRLGNVVAVGLVAYLLWRMGVVLWNVPVTPEMIAPPPDVMISYGAVEKPAEFGSTMAIGDSLFHEYLFPFEAVSLVLLIAVIGALAVARPHEQQPGATPAPGTPS